MGGHRTDGVCLFGGREDKACDIRPAPWSYISSDLGVESVTSPSSVLGLFSSFEHLTNGLTGPLSVRH